MYLLGRRLFTRESAVRFVLWSILGFAAYSTLVSICQFYAPSLVWPRYIVRAPLWPGRANGVFNQPVGNGMVLIVGFVIAIVLATDRGEPAWRRALLWLYALTSTLAIYLTHTRANYLAFALVLILGVLLVPGARGVFAGLIGAVTLLVGLNWSTFTSSDRAAGGIGSKDEVWDRLNGIATSIWAFKREPWFGWGISRFPAVNFYDHQQWSNDVPWIRGLGLASHETELGILVELGVFGLLLWLCVLVPIIGLLLQAYWILPSAELIGRRLAFVAICAMATQIVSGTFADMRLLDGPTCMLFLICGIPWGPVTGSWPRANPDRHCGWLPRLCPTTPYPAGRPLGRLPCPWRCHDAIRSPRAGDVRGPGPRDRRRGTACRDVDAPPGPGPIHMLGRVHRSRGDSVRRPGGRRDPGGRPAADQTAGPGRRSRPGARDAPTTSGRCAGARVQRGDAGPDRRDHCRGAAPGGVAALLR